jgi:hypothetical protein
MNPLMEEYSLEEHRKDIDRELVDIHLQEQALNGKAHRPSLFTHTMQRLGQWLIVRGEKMVERYEVPSNSTKSAKSSKHRFAH